MERNFTNVSNLSLVLFAADISSQVIKIDVTPVVRTGINQFNLGALTNKFLNVPVLTSHCLHALTSGTSDNLKYNKRYIKK